MRAYREDATEAAARTAEEHIAHKSVDSDLVDTIDLSKLLTNPKSRSDHGAPSPLDFGNREDSIQAGDYLSRSGFANSRS